MNRTVRRVPGFALRLAVILVIATVWPFHLTVVDTLTWLASGGIVIWASGLLSRLYRWVNGPPPDDGPPPPRSDWPREALPVGPNVSTRYVS